MRVQQVKMKLDKKHYHYALAFLVFAVMLAIRESSQYGHVYDFLPIIGRTIPFFLLSVVLFVIYRIHGGSVQSIGFAFPKHIGSFSATCVWILKWALLILFMRIGSAFVIQPILQLLPEQAILTRANPLVGNLELTLFILPLMWLAVIGEELLFRGLLIRYLTIKLGEERIALVAAVVISAVLFGALHFWKGPAGMISSGVAGLVFGVGYLLTNRNLWPCTIAHCAGNTIGFISTAVSN